MEEAKELSLPQPTVRTESTAAKFYRDTAQRITSTWDNLTHLLHDGNQVVRAYHYMQFTDTHHDMISRIMNERDLVTGWFDSREEEDRLRAAKLAALAGARQGILSHDRVERLFGNPTWRDQIRAENVRVESTTESGEPAYAVDKITQSEQDFYQIMGRAIRTYETSYRTLNRSSNHTEQVDQQVFELAYSLDLKNHGYDIHIPYAFIAKFEQFFTHYQQTHDYRRPSLSEVKTEMANYIPDLTTTTPHIVTPSARPVREADHKLMIGLIPLLTDLPPGHADALAAYYTTTGSEEERLHAFGELVQLSDQKEVKKLLYKYRGRLFSLRVSPLNETRSKLKTE